MWFYQCVTAVFFQHFSLRQCCFVSCAIHFQLLKLVSMSLHSHTAGGQTVPSAQRLSSIPPGGQPSPFPTQRSSSTYPAGGQTLPSPPSGHPPHLLAAGLTPPHPAVVAVKLSPLHPAVILHPSPSSGHGSQTLPSHPAVMAVKLSPPTQWSWSWSWGVLGHG